MTFRHGVMVAVATASVGLAASAFAQGTPLKIKEERAGLLKLAKVSPRAAQATAQAKFPAGTIVAAEIEREKGKLIYSFDIQQKGVKGIEEVNVDAVTGAVIGIEHENPVDEARERAVEKAQAKPKKTAAP